MVSNLNWKGYRDWPKVKTVACLGYGTFSAEQRELRYIIRLIDMPSPKE